MVIFFFFLSNELHSKYDCTVNQIDKVRYMNKMSVIIFIDITVIDIIGILYICIFKMFGILHLIHWHFSKATIVYIIEEIKLLIYLMTGEFSHI